jgi:hypothetical protein
VSGWATDGDMEHSHTPTRARARTHTHTHTHTQDNAHKLKHVLSHSHAHTRSHIHTHSLSHTQDPNGALIQNKLMTSLKHVKCHRALRRLAPSSAPAGVCVGSGGEGGWWMGGCTQNTPKHTHNTHTHTHTHTLRTCVRQPMPA